MTKRRKRILVLCIIAVSITALVLSPLFPFLRSLLVMGAYSGVHHRQGLPAQEGIDLRIPGGLSTSGADYYPFVMTFVADESYAYYTAQPDAQLTILYNFPAFSLARGCSRLFDETSPYYNSFYGAYVVRDGSNAALARGGQDDGTLAAAVAAIAEFDFFYLVLGDFGLLPQQQVFDFAITEWQQGVHYAGSEGWTRLRSRFRVNGSAHNRREGVTSYLQYGAPNFGAVADEFAPVEMSGLIYGKYFEEWDAGIYFYVMGLTDEICDACDENILQRSTLR